MKTLVQIVLWSLISYKPILAYSSSYHSGMKCSVLFSQGEAPNREEIMKLLFRIETGQKSELISGLNSYFDQTWNSTKFKQYVSRIDGIWRNNYSVDKMYSLVKNFVYDYLSRFEDSKFLGLRQNQLMKKILSDRGIGTTPSNSWREDLQMQSKINLKRFLDRIVDFRPESQEIIDAVNSIEMYMYDTRNITERPNLPLVAPVVIDQMGPTGISEITGDFNRFIGSDQHVHFVISFKRRSDSAIEARRVFGHPGVILKTSVAKELAIVSPRTMNHNHLARIAEILNPNLAQRYISANTKINERGGLEWIPSSSEVGTHDLTIQIQKSLGQLDFTFDDAEHLIKACAIKKLHELKVSDPLKFHEYMEEIEHKPLGHISFFIKQEVMPELGFKSGADFEGQVPVAVPARDLIYFDE